MAVTKAGPFSQHDEFPPFGTVCAQCRMSSSVLRLRREDNYSPIGAENINSAMFANTVNSDDLWVGANAGARSAGDQLSHTSANEGGVESRFY